MGYEARNRVNPPPFLWNKTYLKSLEIPLRDFLLQKFEEDCLKLRFERERYIIDWKEKIGVLRKRFVLKYLRGELGYKYRTLWQWQAGARIPNLDACIRLKSFCDEHCVKLL